MDASVIVSPVLNYAIECASTVALVLGAWTLNEVRLHFKYGPVDGLLDQIEKAMPRAVADAEAKAHEAVELHPLSLAISNPIERLMVSYVLKQFPGVVKRLGVSPEQVGGFVKAWLAKRDADAVKTASVPGVIVTPAPSPTDATKPAWGTAASFAGP